MEDDNNFERNINNNPLSVIDEKPELTTLVAATKMQNDNQSLLSNKILSKLSRGYTLFTVIKVISYSINETSFFLPYCLRKLGIIPFMILLILLVLPSIYIFYMMIDTTIKYNLFNNYHQIIQEKTNKYYNISYYFLNIIYHILLIILENFLYVSLFQRILVFFDIDMKNKFYEKLIILSLSLISIELPITFIKRLFQPDLPYIITTIVIILINVTSLIIVIINKSNNNINLIKVNIFEDFSQDYFIGCSIILTVIGWQNQLAKHLNTFKIKTTKRFYKVIYLFFIVGAILILFICILSTPLINEKGDLILFLLDYKKLNFASIIFILIMSITFCLLIHIIIGHHIQLIQENLLLTLKLVLYKRAEDDFEINKLFSIIFNLFILFLCNIICLFTEDISLIILLYGGIFTPILNHLIPTCLYYFMVSSNSIVIWLAWIIDFMIISLGLVGFILKIFL